MSEQSPLPAPTFTALSEAVSHLSRLAAAAEKVLRAADAERDPPAALAALSTVSRLLPALSAEAFTPEALAAVETTLTEAVTDWRLTRLQAFKEAAEGAGLPWQRLTTDEMRVGEATVRLDLDKGEADILYARETLDVVRAEPRAVVEGVRKHLAALTRADEPAVVFQEIAQAYRILLARLGLAFGERVNLVDLLPALFFVRQPESFWKKQEPKALRPVTRAQLAWDLDHLQHAHSLEHDGLRIGLGTATGGSTAKKANVLFLESAPAGGQYFLTFAMRAVPPATVAPEA